MYRSALRSGLAAAATAVVLVGCGGGGGAQSGSSLLQANEVTPTLKGMPFRYRISRVTPPAGDNAAFAGLARRNGIVTRFSIGLGDPPRALPVDGVGTSRATYMPNMGFAFNTDSEFVRRYKTLSELHVAGHMMTIIVERLCKKVSGDPCPV